MSKYADGQHLVIDGGGSSETESLPDHWLVHPFESGEVVEVLDLDHNTDEYDHAIYLVEAPDGVYGYVSEANLKEKGSGDRHPNGQLTIEPGAELPWPCRHLDDPAAPDCDPLEHCCGGDCPRHDEEADR